MDFSLAHDPKLKGVDDVPNLGMITRLHMAVAQLKTRFLDYASSVAYETS